MDSENVDGVAHDLVSLLTREDRDFLVRNNGHQVFPIFSVLFYRKRKLERNYAFLMKKELKQVKVESLKGKKIWLYFSASWCGPCRRFTPKLVEAYNELSSNDDFEIIFVSGDNDDESFNGYFSKMPWLAIPFSDSDARDQLNELFKVMGIPNLVMLDESGKVLSEDGVDIIQEYGVEAYPFTPEKIKEMKEKEETARKEQSLRSILVSQSRDYVISTDGKKVPVSELEGKWKDSSLQCCRGNPRTWDSGIPFYPEKFAELEEIEKAKREAQTLESILVSGDRDFVIGKDGVKGALCPFFHGEEHPPIFLSTLVPPMPCFSTKTYEAYQKIKTKDEAFEVIFISSDKDQTSFDEFFSGPWHPLAHSHWPTGRTVTTEARNLVMIHGADAYPFTEEHIKEIEAQYEEMAKGWPEKMKHALHEEHELVLTKRRVYGCNGCEKQGHLWSFYCEECDFDLHPKCALEEDKGTKDDEMEKASPGEGWKCDGEVCYKA
ncbi:putative nucleoredoxin 1 [Vitis vinifera]|uniref:protein-disulfide reductase n=1 Tax=Vitis vinifera TaxID=29760 RepID=A0A438JNS1_VITVI|nr:putative nucleoredoxin 1 [Vitis vinifera]